MDGRTREDDLFVKPSVNLPWRNEQSTKIVKMIGVPTGDRTQYVPFTNQKRLPLPASSLNFRNSTWPLWLYSCCMYDRIKMFWFLFLQVALEKYRSLAEWSGTSYLWFAFHWLAMSHSCYNPVIYCWMNTRFRAGFCTAFGRVPCVRRLVPLTARHRHCNTSSLTGMGLTGNAARANCRL